jgi:predicted nucleic acid-binding Zn ribbon protein
VRRRAPRPAALAVEAVRERLAPRTTLALVQSAWAAAVGEAIAREARPVREREGVVDVACASSVWAQELDLMGPSLAERLNAELGAVRVRSLRCSVAPGERD